MSTVGERLDSLSDICGISKTEVAAAFGVSKQSFRNWVTRNTIPPGDKIYRAKHRIKLNEEWLYKGGNRPPILDRAPDPDLDELKVVFRDLTEPQKERLLEAARDSVAANAARKPL